MNRMVNRQEPASSVCYVPVDAELCPQP